MLPTIRWDADLIRRYDHAGPRYTSYPTAVQFHDGVKPADFLHAIDASREAGRQLSLYVHVPFCANICYYCACNKVITKDRSRSREYLASLQREMELISAHLGPDQVVEQLHFGGGTPTFLSHQELRELMAGLRSRFSLRDDDIGDYSIEIDPREADWATMGLLRELGFNRVSFGVQDLDPEVQRAVNRLQTLEQTQAVMDAARTLAYRSINIDLIYGLPKQTPESFARTVEAIIALKPDRLSVFNYAHLPERFMPQRRINSADLPSPAQKLEMFENSVRQLLAAGYRYIGMDHFALPDDSLSIAQENGELQRNFQGYTTHGHCDLIGLGVSSISQVGDLYCQNSSDLKVYQERLQADELATQRGLVCHSDDIIRRAVISQLICHFQLQFSDIEARFGIDFPEYFASCLPMLEQMARDGLIILTPGGIRVMAAGRLLVRSICMLFDAYQSDTSQQRFSRII
ncbi:MAG: oxygen-independent coproporphyrinogen III oxidase [Pseudomonadales bacterium]|jgi:oxygen-independent coproporphyrinogen-3 oxidase|uniref:Coproporphyrinogen-III oxidase n=1 Tax=Halopseudomonas aestusnigri TaxID=857252 RepID=A0AAQ1JNS5_9GAMM|nr:MULTISPECIES: oxygen-independent coproporphyrinogen III oxidase [Halopseudomonas]MAH01520.1 oxygen-independent coproporphyrinogen III oxidase [Pseudomonadales bacterium]MEE2799543.1 oxygen-independent coproporphyrinogen III oxidase [Pseudomonadota bacterium]HBT57416.1 oxygen-independent coproporphyrinogen III oxidase [Pseudomonas sp.]MAK74678.1 oxygen-independent coproporphyrinogen III oxidase [Pseudomonadales bacterium]MAP76682.1 oxygen-independent coproporphyrinogen III oxidase [Pseudomon|tara:strand:+ start:7968 stop:9350 length:1383 start_codon:yes stop_codon:yes gene_type:complete